MNTPVQRKDENNGGIKNSLRAEIHDRAGLFFGAFGMAIAFLAIGVSWQSDKRADDVVRIQDQQIAQLTKDVMLLREDIRELTIAVGTRSK